MSDKELKSDLSDDESTTEESSTSEEEWTEESEKTFFKTLSSLKSKDPKIYDENVKFFNENTVTKHNVDVKDSSKNKEEPLFLRDYERKIILEKGGILEDEDSEDEGRNPEKFERLKSPTYVQEQKMLKDSFKKLLASDDEEQSENENNTAGFLKVKVKSADQKAKEEEEYVEWLKGQKSELNDKEAEVELKYLRDYWMNPDLDDGEQFLRDYILNKRHLDPYEEDVIKSEVTLSEDEKELDECDKYVQKYNFRFEEPDKDFIKTYPRVIENSLRRKDDKRKKKREEKKKRKEELLEQKRLEVKQLKKQKKQELLDKIKKLKEITGNQELGFDDKDLQNDFNANEYDKKMSELFNEEFYAHEEDDKPQFSDSDSLFDEGEENELVENEISSFDQLENVDCAELNGDEIIPENDDFIMDCDYDPQEQNESKFKKQTRSSRRKGHKKSTFMQKVKRDKPLFNPADKTFQQYVDEYYGLEFEDIIGDMPCRFKYRKVMPNNFGLTVEEILAADDKELNRWCSMQKVDTIRPEQNEKFDLKVYARRAQNIDLKKKFLPSLFKDEEVTKISAGSTDQSSEIHKKKKKNLKKKQGNIASTSDVSGKKDIVPLLENSGKNDNDDHRVGKRKAIGNLDEPLYKKQKNSKSKESSTKTNTSASITATSKTRNSNFKRPNRNSLDFAMSDERLKAYGINPKKFKNKMKYGKHADR